MGPGSPGPTKPSPTPPKMTPDMTPQKDKSQIMMTPQTSQPNYEQELENIKKAFKEGFDRLYGGLESLVNYAGRLTERTEEAHRRIDNLEDRITKAEETLEKHEKRLTNLENELGDLKNYIEDRFKQIDERFGYVKQALGTLKEAIRNIPISYEVCDEVQPGTPGAKLIVTPEGEKWYVCRATQGIAGNYTPVKQALEKAEGTLNKI